MKTGTTMPVVDAVSHLGPVSLGREQALTWRVVIVHPSVLMPVASSEVVAASRLLRRNQRAISVVSVLPDTLARVTAWANTVESAFGYSIEHPCIADADGAVSLALRGGVEGPLPLRGAFIFAPDQTLASATVLPDTVGLSSLEIERVLAALMLTRHGQMLAPVDWEPGMPLMDRDDIRDCA